LDVFGHE